MNRGIFATVCGTRTVFDGEVIPQTVAPIHSEELKFLAGINHNCTMYISISYEHHE